MRENGDETLARFEHFYNSARRHSALGYLTPEEFEQLPLSVNAAKTLITVGH